MPTTVMSGPSAAMRKRLPRATSPGQNLVASAWLTIATRTPSCRSADEIMRPESSGIPSAANDDGVTRRLATSVASAWRVGTPSRQKDADPSFAE